MEYTVKRYKRAKRVRVRVNARGEVVVTAGKRTPKYVIEAFVETHREWLRGEQDRRARARTSPLGAASREAYLQYKEAARVLAHARLVHYNEQYRFAYNRVYIRDTTSRWGSCSSKRNLNFSYKIVHLPPRLADYIIVHELCHLQEMNHSPAFWALVAQQIPEYQECRAQLRRLTSP